MSIDGHYETHIVPKLLLQVSVWELHNIMASPPEEGGIKYAMDEENNIISSGSTPRNIMTPQPRKISVPYKVVCGCGCFISAKIMHSYLL